MPAGSTTADVDESTLPAGYVQTAGTDPSTVNVPAGSTTDIGEDGYQPQGTVTGHLFRDTNGNGVQDAGEDGIANVTIELSTNGTVIATTVTDTAGAPVAGTTAYDGTTRAATFTPSP